MIVVKRFYPQVRLRKLMSAPGGITIQEALEAAASAVESMRDFMEPELDRKIAALQLVLTGTDPQRFEDARFLTNEIQNEGGVMGHDELSVAAGSFSRLLANGGGETQPDAVRVHMDALRALRSPEFRNERAARAMVLEGLNKISCATVEANTEAPKT